MHNTRVSVKYYASSDEAIRAGKRAFGGKYGDHPQFYTYRTPKGFGYSRKGVKRLPGQHNVLLVHECPNYFREAIHAVVGKYPPMEVPRYGAHDMGNEVIELQDWCASNARPEWATGLSMIEAAELIVQQALDNANIKKD